MNSRQGNMRFPESELLFGDEWLQLRKADNRYTFTHEVRCDGNIVVVLPFEKEEAKELAILARVEDTPCWDGNNPLPCSLTGGVDVGETPQQTAVKELQEEIGFVVSEEELISLGTFYGTKSSDTIYHIFAVQITQETKKVDPTDKNSLGIWLNIKNISVTKDPFLLASALRLQYKLIESKTCNRCVYSKIVQDPDPNDSFNYDDTAIVCTITPAFDGQLLSQAGIKFKNALVASALRPYEIKKITRPIWCPKIVDFE